MELIKTRCKQGSLVVTDQVVRVHLLGMESRTIVRSAIVAIDYELTIPSVFGYGGGASLVFHAQSGDQLHADLVKPKIAKEIMQLLGF
jgi:hypothetical protein